jgi:undecaprenyl-diphosphatase
MTDLGIIFLADYLLYLFLAGVIFFLLATGQKNLLFRCLLTAFLAWLFGLLLKNLFYLPRPFILAGNLPLARFNLDGSFPSNHSAMAFGLAIPLLKHRSKTVGLTALIIAVLVAVGRVLGGVHTLIDVAAGAVIALFISLFTIPRG